MDTFLTSFCKPDAATRRRVLHDTLARLLPNRLSIERYNWPKRDSVEDTVNYIISFGQQKNQLVIGAHYDAVPGSPGANDNGASVAQLLLAAVELDKAIAGGKPEPNCTFCFWDHEERFGSKYMGSKCWIESHAAESPACAIVFDVTGSGRHYVSGHDETGLLSDLRSRSTPPSDSVNFRDAGIPVTLVCALPDDQFDSSYPQAWRVLHTSIDTTDTINISTMEDGKQLTIKIIRRFSKLHSSPRQ